MLILNEKKESMAFLNGNPYESLQRCVRHWLSTKCKYAVEMDFLKLSILIFGALSSLSLNLKAPPQLDDLPFE